MFWKILASLIGIPFGGKTPFRTEMYFVNLRAFLDLKWGTTQPIALRDPDLGLARLRAFGTFAMAVDDAPLFVNKIVGGQGLYTTDDIMGYLRGMVTSRFSDILGTLGLGLFDLPSNYDEIGAALAAALRDEFQALGLALKAIYVTNISTTEETQKAIDERASMSALGDMDKYMRYKAAESMQDAAKQPGGAAGPDPIGPLLRGLRAASPSLHAFLRDVGGLTSFEDLTALYQSRVGDLPTLQ